MIDEIFDRNYQHGRTALNAAIANGLKQFSQSVGEAFLALNRSEAPRPDQLSRDGGAGAGVEVSSGGGPAKGQIVNSKLATTASK